MRFKFAYAALAAVPVTLLAFSTGPPTKRTGAAIDGGLNCTACHSTFAPANSDPRGSVTIAASTYVPGVTQTIKVTVQHPEAIRWGFEITARMVSDQTKQAGTFTVNDVVRVRCDTTPAADAPCNGALEFPEHKSAPFTDAGVGFTFSVDWTPPATDVGDIVFFAAGNAANGDRNLTGDHIYTTSKVVSSSTACSLTAKPTIRAVESAASFQSGIAPNSLITIFGQGFMKSGATRTAQSFDFAGNAYPKQLGCVAVEIDGQRVPITYLQSDQINAQAPTTADLGSVSVKVILNPDAANQVSSDAGTVQMQRQMPAFFTFDGKSIAAVSGSGTLVANPAVVTGASPAKPGDVVSLYATGCGFTNPVFQAGELSSGLATIPPQFSITVGGVALAAADVLYAGLSPGSISGLYQFNVRIPAAAPDGDVPVVLQVNGVASQTGATIAVKR
jgi:uncharacterized protein (TIGR03437 family)